MRGRLSNLVWVLVILAATAALLVTPPLRDRMLALAGPGPLQADFLAQAKKMPRDASAWLAALSYVTVPDLSTSDIAAAYRQAAQLDPESPVPHILFAVRVMPRSTGRQEALDAFGGQPRASDHPGEHVLTADEREQLAAADNALEYASALDPSNAAVDYLRAYTAFAEGRDEAACAHLEIALSKHLWNTCQRDARIAVYQTGLTFLPAAEASSHATGIVYSTTMPYRRLSQLLTGMAILAQRANNHSRAIFLSEAVIHQAELTLSNAYDTTDLMGAVLAWVFATTEWRGEANSRDAQQQDIAGDNVATSDESRVPSAGDIWPPDAVGLAEYLREHGRTDLAEELESWSPVMRSAYERSRLQRDTKQALGNRHAVLFDALGHAATALVGSLLLLSASGIAAVALWSVRRPVREITWPAWGPLLLVSGCLAAVVGAALLSAGGSVFQPSLWGAVRNIAADLGVEPPPAPLSLRPWGSYFVVIALPLLVILTLAIVLVHRRRHPEAREVGPVRQWLGTLLRLLLPLSALLSIAVLALAIPASLAAQAQSEVNRAIIYQGEVAYYGADLPAPR